MAQFTTPSQLDGLFKMAYGDDVENLVPESARLVKMIDFVPTDKETGDKYNQPVVLAQEHGVTYAAAGAGAFSLNNSIAMTMKNAQLEGSQLLLRSALSYDAAAKASNSKKAFVKSTELLVENMMESMTKRLELALLYGQSTTGIGNPASSANVDATHTAITITLLTWASGIWAGLEGATIDVLDAGVVVNTTGAVTIDSVDLDTRIITVSAAAGDITAIDAVTFTTADAIVFRGALSAEMSGIDAIITNTSTLFGIDASVYNLWKGNSSSAASGTLTIGKILTGLAEAVNRGLNEKVAVFVNPITWEGLNDDLSALRMFDSSYKAGKGEQGNEAITYHGQNGTIDLYSHLYVKQGEAFAIPMSKTRRIGAQDVSFKTPGGREGEIFRHLEDRAGYELRVYTDQAVLIEAPARCVKYTNIVN